MKIPLKFVLSLSLTFSGNSLQAQNNPRNGDPCDPCRIPVEPIPTPSVPPDIVGEIVGRMGTEYTVRWIGIPPVGLYQCGTEVGSFAGTVSPSMIERRYYVPKGTSRNHSVKFNNSYASPCDGISHSLASTQGWVNLYGKSTPPPGPGDPGPGEPPPGPGGPQPDPNTPGGGINPGESSCGPVFPEQICSPPLPDNRVAPTLADPTRVEIVCEQIVKSVPKYGFNTFNDQPADEIPKIFRKRTLTTTLVGGDPESPMGGKVVEEICRQTGEIIRSSVTGRPGSYGFNPPSGLDPGATTWSGAYEATSYDDCPNLKEPDEPGAWDVKAELQDLYTQEQFKQDTFNDAWDFKGYFDHTSPDAYLWLPPKQTRLEYAKIKYKIRVPADIPRPYKAVWIEEFTPEDPDDTDDITPPKEYKLKTEDITGAESTVHTIDPATDPEKHGYWTVYLFAVEEVWSNQIDEVEVNGFPDKTGQKEYPYILIGANSGNTLELKIKLTSDIPKSAQSKMLFRLVSEGITGELIPETGTSRFLDGRTAVVRPFFESSFVYG